MTRNSSTILPFCKYCGEYKGLGPCRNPDCRETNLLEHETLSRHKNKCTICGEIAVNHCMRCGLGYCRNHSMQMEEKTLVSMDQHLGTCTICREVVCEQCWIFNHLGFITCQVHNPNLKNDDS